MWCVFAQRIKDLNPVLGSVPKKGHVLKSIKSGPITDFTFQLFCNSSSFTDWKCLREKSFAWYPLYCGSTCFRGAEHHGILLVSETNRCFASLQTEPNINSTFAKLCIYFKQAVSVLLHAHMQTWPWMCVFIFISGGNRILHCGTWPACLVKVQHVWAHHLPKTFPYKI